MDTGSYASVALGTFFDELVQLINGPEPEELIDLTGRRVAPRLMVTLLGPGPYTPGGADPRLRPELARQLLDDTAFALEALYEHAYLRQGQVDLHAKDRPTAVHLVLAHWARVKCMHLVASYGAAIPLDERIAAGAQLLTSRFEYWPFKITETGISKQAMILAQIFSPQQAGGMQKVYRLLGAGHLTDACLTLWRYEHGFRFLDDEDHHAAGMAWLQFARALQGKLLEGTGRSEPLPQLLVPPSLHAVG